MSQKIVLACLAAMVIAGLVAYPLDQIGWGMVAGVVFLIATVTAWIAAAARFIVWHWR